MRPASVSSSTASKCDARQWRPSVPPAPFPCSPPFSGPIRVLPAGMSISPWAGGAGTFSSSAPSSWPSCSRGESCLRVGNPLRRRESLKGWGMHQQLERQPHESRTPCMPGTLGTPTTHPPAHPPPLPTRPPTLRPPTHSPALRLLTSRPPPSVFMLLPRFMAWVLTISGAYTNKSAEVQAACRTDQSSALANSPWFRVPYPGKHCGAAWACVSAMSVREYYARVRACMHVCVITHMGACVNMYVLQPCTHATRRNAARDHARTRRPVGRADRFRLQHAHHARRRAARDDRIVGGLLRLRPDRRRADAAAGRAEPRDLLAGERARPAGF
jgi:hypothetical protein